jgi:alkanesulfonate monooxygenase SsuD/methylene tetrahydromethanopterin reductase-like flavin-dependent oxidoreductase (luciferase family)
MKISQIQSDVRDELSERLFILGSKEPGADLLQDLIQELERFRVHADLDLEEIQRFRKQVRL